MFFFFFIKVKDNISATKKKKQKIKKTKIILQGLLTERVINHFLLLKKKGYNEIVFYGFPTLL